jgi:putative hydrolase of the HAD superfamily
MIESGHVPLEGVVLALDVDGVVLDSALSEQGEWKSRFGERFNVDAEQLSTEFFASAWAGVVRGTTDIEPELENVINRLGWSMTVEEALDAWFEADFSPNLQVVEAAKGWSDLGARLVLVTNQEHRRARYLQSHLAALLPLHDVIYSAAVGYLKDEVAFYRAADQQLGATSSTPVVFVDDTLRNVVVARQHGWRAIHFERSSTWRSLIEEALGDAAHDTERPLEMDLAPRPPAVEGHDQ